MLLPLLLALSGPVRPIAAAEHGLIVKVDSAAHTVTLTGGRYDIAAGAEEMPGMPMGMMKMQTSSLLRFTWPVTGWIRGVRLRLYDAAGKPVSRKLVHHINVVNFGRRQLFYAIPERMIAMGEETEDIRIPATVGIPVTADWPMAALVMWHNPGGAEVKGVSFEMTVEYSPTNLVPRPTSLLPVYLDVMNPVGKDVDFDLPAGPTSWQKDFKLPLTGRIVGVGGHAHDFATGLMLKDVTDVAHPRTVVSLKIKLSSKGEIQSVDRQLPGITGDGIKLLNSHLYRLVGTYNNPTGAMIEKGAMLHMALLYVPDHPDQWPKLDVHDADWIKDVARLHDMGEVPQEKK
ncbi:MAG TPA: hypothetical protein VGM77_13925 [Gemmatimonadales bacterium]|jgi:hypothetical protein